MGLLLTYIENILTSSPEFSSGRAFLVPLILIAIDYELLLGKILIQSNQWAHFLFIYTSARVFIFFKTICICECPRAVCEDEIKRIEGR